jgi:murein DD-endopeptidase MepM/ murein hydrolase activator NlpD
MGRGSQPRVIVLALTAFAAAGCSADQSCFSGDMRCEATGAIAAQPAGGYWSWDGGVAVTVAYGDTVNSIARRHHVPASALIQANNLAAPNALQPGQHLVIPRLISSPAAVRPVMPHPDVAALVPPASIPTGGEDVAVGAGEHVAAPENRTVRNSPPLPRTKPALEQHPVKQAEQTPPAKLPVPPDVKSPDVKSPDPDPVKAEDAAPRFHWPVRGQVVSGFGLKADGLRNDGIDIAVPENTPIKAADDGVVIYSGNQLKTFGNLVLVRHNNQYVTAYAHAKDLRVKQGDAIKAGEIIGTSGQTGNVATPQLHFEIRKGSTPVDPMRLLHGV